MLSGFRLHPDRFIETNLSGGSGSMVSLNVFERRIRELIPSSIRLYDALSRAGVNVDYTMNHARSILCRIKSQGLVSKYRLTDDEAMCIAAYTIEVHSGQSMYTVLNRVLRSPRSESSLIPIAPLLVLFLRSLRKLPLVEKTDLYRAIDVTLTMNKGPSMWWAFTSTTWNMDVTNTFVGSHGGSLLIIKGNCKGYDVSEFSEFPAEKELLIEPETRFNVSSLVRLGGGLVVQCDISPSQPVLLNLAPYNHSSSASSSSSYSSSYSPYSSPPPPSSYSSSPSVSSYSSSPSVSSYSSGTSIGPQVSFKKKPPKLYCHYNSQGELTHISSTPHTQSELHAYEMARSGHKFY